MEKIINCPHCGEKVTLSFNPKEVTVGGTIEGQCSYCSKKFAFVVLRKGGLRLYSTDYKCPKCGGDNIQPFELIYMGGTSGFRAGTTGIGIVGNSVAGGIAVTSGELKTYLAEYVAPPGEINPCFLFAIAIVVGLVSFFLGLSSHSPAYFVLLSSLVAFFITLFFLLRVHYNDSKDLLIEQEIWRNSFLCFKCNTRFIVKR